MVRAIVNRATALPKRGRHRCAMTKRHDLIPNLLAIFGETFMEHERGLRWMRSPRLQQSHELGNTTDPAAEAGKFAAEGQRRPGSDDCSAVG